MLHPAKMLAKLTAGTVKLQRSAAGFTPEAVTKAELAAVLSGLPAHIQRLLMVKWLADNSELPKLRTAVLLHGADLAKAKGWTGEKGWKARQAQGLEPLRNLCLIALADVIGSQKCDLCDGRKWLYPVDRPPESCPKCLGTGVSSPSGRTLAAQFGVDEAAWRRGWGLKYQPIVGMVHGWEAYGLSHIVSRLGE